MRRNISGTDKQRKDTTIQREAVRDPIISQLKEMTPEELERWIRNSKLTTKQQITLLAKAILFLYRRKK